MARRDDNRALGKRVGGRQVFHMLQENSPGYASWFVMAAVPTIKEPTSHQVVATSSKRRLNASMAKLKDLTKRHLEFSPTDTGWIRTFCTGRCSVRNWQMMTVKGEMELHCRVVVWREPGKSITWCCSPACLFSHKKHAGWYISYYHLACHGVRLCGDSWPRCGEKNGY